MLSVSLIDDNICFYLERTTKIVHGLCVYLDNKPWTFKISPNNPGLSFYLENGHFSLFRDENTLLGGFGGFGQFGLFTF